LEALGFFVGRGKRRQRPVRAFVATERRAFLVARVLMVQAAKRAPPGGSRRASLERSMTRWPNVFSILAAALVAALCLSVPAATQSSGLPFADGSLPASVTATAPGTTTMGAPCAAGDQRCCQHDLDCDDGDPCTVDVCVPTTGCTHAPVGLDLVRGEIEGALATQACVSEPVPARITGPLTRARRLIERAGTRPADGQALLVASAAQRLTTSAGRTAGAALHGLINDGCASALSATIELAEGHAACLLSAATSVEKPFACLAGRGPLIRLSGRRTKEFRKHSIAPGTRIDARGATFLGSSSARYPISIDGGGGVCIAGGAVRGQYDRKLDWATMHDMNNAAVAFTSPTTVDGVRIDNVEDGIRPEKTGPFTIRAVHLSYIRDDCVEDDHNQGGLIADSLFDGCYVALSERPSPSINNSDGRNQLLTIRGSLLRLQPMPGPRHGSASELGNGEFFKWSDQASKLALYDNVFMAEKASQDGADKMGVPPTLAGCANNVMVWLGPGDYPAPLPSCFTVTKDRTVWDTAVADWLHRHPHVAR